LKKICPIQDTSIVKGKDEDTERNIKNAESSPVLKPSQSETESGEEIGMDKRKSETLRSKLLDLKLENKWSYEKICSLVNNAVGKKQGFSKIKRKALQMLIWSRRPWTSATGLALSEWMKQENYLNESEIDDPPSPMVKLNDEELASCADESIEVKEEEEEKYEETDETEDQPAYTKFCLDCEGCPGSGCDHTKHPRVPVVEDIHRVLKGHTNYSDLGEFMCLPISDVAYNTKHGSAVRTSWESLVKEGKMNTKVFESPVMCKITECSSSFSDSIDTFLHISVNHLPLNTSLSPKSEDSDEEDETPAPRTPTRSTEESSRGTKRSRSSSVTDSPRKKKIEKYELLNPKLFEDPYFASHLGEVRYVTETEGYKKEPRLPDGWTSRSGSRPNDHLYKSPDNHVFRSLSNAKKYIKLTSGEDMEEP